MPHNPFFLGPELGLKEPGRPRFVPNSPQYPDSGRQSSSVRISAQNRPVPTHNSGSHLLPALAHFSSSCCRGFLQLSALTLGRKSRTVVLLLFFSAMALVVICGQPCSGKSTAASCLSEALKALNSKPTVRIIDESSLHLGRNQSYANMIVEKNLRGVLRSEVDRSLSKDSIIIVDSLNNIKGYRYELWCLARAAGIRYCVLFCDTDENQCREWNRKRGTKGDPTYDDSIFEDLARRFEKPDRRNRWDSPLFELWPSKDGVEQSSTAIAEAVSYLTRIVDSKSRDVKLLQPTIATQNVRVSEVNSLYEMDRATQEVINAIVEAQSQGFGGPMNRISLGSQLPIISIQRQVGLPELRSLRRTFMKLTGQSSLSGPPPPSDADSAKRMFVDYLNREIGAA